MGGGEGRREKENWDKWQAEKEEGGGWGGWKEEE